MYSYFDNFQSLHDNTLKHGWQNLLAIFISLITLLVLILSVTVQVACIIWNILVRVNPYSVRENMVLAHDNYQPIKSHHLCRTMSSLPSLKMYKMIKIPTLLTSLTLNPPNFYFYPQILSSSTSKKLVWAIWYCQETVKISWTVTLYLVQGQWTMNTAQFLWGKELHWDNTGHHHSVKAYFEVLSHCAEPF